MKYCWNCKLEKLESDFNKNKHKPDGLATECRECCKIKIKFWRENTEKGKTYGKRYRKNKLNSDPLYFLLADAKRRALLKKIPFELTTQELKIPDCCPVLGIPLFFTPKKCTPNTPSIDRIDNSKGYTLDNVLIVSFKVNTIKNYSTPDELIKIGNFYKELESK